MAMAEPSSILSNFVNTAITALIDRRVFVRLSDASAFSGILHRFTPGQSIILRHATMIEAKLDDEINSDLEPTFELLMKEVTHIVDSTVSSYHESNIAAFQIKEFELNGDAKEFFPAMKKHLTANFMVGPQISGADYIQNNYRQMPHGSYSSAPMIPSGNFVPAHQFPQTNFGPAGNLMQPVRFPGQYYGAQPGPYLPMNPQFGMTQGVPSYGSPAFYPAPHHVQFPSNQGFGQGQAMQQPYLGPSAGPTARPPFYPVPHQQFQAPGPIGFFNSNFW